jgi:hypothetical protein
MPHPLKVDTLASVMRELRKKLTILPFDTQKSEESIGLAPQKYVNPEKWGVTAIVI